MLDIQDIFVHRGTEAWAQVELNCQGVWDLMTAIKEVERLTNFNQIVTISAVTCKTL